MWLVAASFGVGGLDDGGAEDPCSEDDGNESVCGV